MEVTKEGSRSWFFTAIYASLHEHLREYLWTQLHHFAQANREPWLLACDFNKTISLAERNHGGQDMERRCLKFRYWVENNGLIDLGFSGPNFTWSRGIMANKDALQRNIGHAVGDGTRTFFWRDIWATHKPLLEDSTSSVPQTSLTLTVADYCDQDRGWRWNDLRAYLQEDTLAKIASFEILEEGTEDRSFSLASSSRTFSLKSALSTLQQIQTPQPSDSWKWVWRLWVPQRVRMFVWLALQDKLLTNVNRVQRGLASDMRCLACDADTEDLDHILQKCPMAVSLWQALSTHSWRCVGNALDLKSWMLANANSKGSPTDWNTKFTLTLWYL
ncbi:hypothetical protein Cgig2_025917 [Carnegiea gigantea]|uniref:Reverse transcriptase zinc-binding domain-containing protein n=1 Tax=Carnegiea gigantea TaxID=171969 RepID=A0A9Q1GK52_9CARY|nr:hypothetical protein Cgig2_025917 [Carnegiea gigantea]